MFSILLITCVLTPYTLVYKNTDGNAKLFSYLELFLDATFLIDMCINFNVAFYDEDFTLIESRKVRDILISYVISAANNRINL